MWVRENPWIERSTLTMPYGLDKTPCTGMSHVCYIKSMDTGEYPHIDMWVGQNLWRVSME